MSERVFACLLLLLGAALSACGQGRATDGRLEIAVVPKGTTHEFWKTVHAGALAAGRELDVDIQWSGPLREDDRDEQIKVLEGMIARGVDAIVLAPLDETALVRVAREADGEGIPVVVFDSDLEWDGRVSYVATDNYVGGVLAARELGRLLEGEGTAIMLRYVEGSSSTMRREAGFLETLQEEFPDIEVVSSNQHTGATPDGAFKAAENLLVSYPGVDGVFCPCEPVVFGMLRALQDAGRAGSVRVVGFDVTDKLLEGVRSGALDALVVQNPFAMGRLAVKAAVDHLAGRTVEPRVDTGVVVVTAANLETDEVRALVSPDLSGLDD